MVTFYLIVVALLIAQELLTISNKWVKEAFALHLIFCVLWPISIPAAIVSYWLRPDLRP